MCSSFPEYLKLSSKPDWICPSRNNIKNGNGDCVNQTGLQKDCTTGCVNVRCTTFPEVSTDGVHVLLIYCVCINILHILVEQLYFPADICA